MVSRGRSFFGPVEKEKNRGGAKKKGVHPRSGRKKIKGGEKNKIFQGRSLISLRKKE